MTSEAELSRIAREAVRQPADPRMDRQLARMGLTDEPDAASRPVAQPSTSSAQSSIDAHVLERLERRLRRLEIVAVLLVVAVVVLAAVLVVRISG
jgi:hypothetical protein